MDAKAISLEEFLSAVLRGAAKILGCGSTNLILISEKTQEVRIRLGTKAVSNPILAEIEQLLGGSFKGMTYLIRDVQDSLIYQSWRDRSIRETSSLGELVGSAIAPQVVAQLTSMIGDHRFICVPALSGTRNYGVILFQKEGRHSFSRQQRELLLRYARRIGEILESDLLGQGQMLFAQLPGGGLDYLLFDGEGTLIGRGTQGLFLEKLLEQSDLLAWISGRVRELLAETSGETAAALSPPPDPELQIDISPFRLGEAPGALCAIRPQRRPAPSLENQLLQLTLGEAAPALFLDTDLCITSYNEATTQLLGYDPVELLHRPIGSIFPEPHDIVGLLSQQILDPRSPYGEESAMVLARDGSIVPVRVETLLLADDQDQVVGFLLLCREVSEAPSEPTDRLVQQERMATMGEMAAQLAHEIRNPLLAIGATLETMKQETLIPAEQRQILASLAREIVRLDMVLKDYLAAPHRLDFCEVDLAVTVNEACRLLQGAYRLAGKRVTSSIEPGISIQADGDALKHVFFNLLLNALEASPQDGEVSCRLVTGAQDCSIIIEDQGPGLRSSPEECFQPFFTTKTNGTGLGLAVCQKIARAHGGVVDLRNRPEGGCRATLVLPRLRTVAAQSPGS